MRVAHDGGAQIAIGGGPRDKAFEFDLARRKDNRFFFHETPKCEVTCKPAQSAIAPASCMLSAYSRKPSLEAITKFAADRMIARLARWLRILGADTIFDPGLDGTAMLKIARAEGRIMLTRDKRIRTSTDAMFIESNDFREQLRQVLSIIHSIFALKSSLDAHDATRCSLKSRAKP